MRILKARIIGRPVSHSLCNLAQERRRGSVSPVLTHDKKKLIEITSETPQALWQSRLPLLLLRFLKTMSSSFCVFCDLLPLLLLTQLNMHLLFSPHHPRCPNQSPRILFLNFYSFLSVPCRSLSFLQLTLSSASFLSHCLPCFSCDGPASDLSRGPAPSGVGCGTNRP